MIKLANRNGDEFTLDGELAVAAVDYFKSAISGAEEIIKLRNELALIRRDITFLVRQYDGEIDATGEACILKGTRREQFEWVCAYLKEHPESSIFAPCVIAVGEIRGPGGYTSARSLQRYCCAHKHAFGG